MSFNYIETTWEPTPAYAVMPDHDVLERSPSPYIPTPPLESMNNTLSGKVFKCIYNVKELQNSLSALTLTKLQMMSTLSDTLHLLHDVSKELKPADLSEAYQSIEPATHADPAMDSDTACDTTSFDDSIDEPANDGQFYSSSDEDDVLPDLTSDTDTNTGSLTDLIEDSSNDSYVDTDKPEMDVSATSLTTISTNSSPQSPQPATTAAPTHYEEADMPADFMVE